MFNMACFCGSHSERRGGEVVNGRFSSLPLPILLLSNKETLQVHIYLPTSDSAFRFTRDSITTASTINAKRTHGVDAWVTLIILQRPTTVWPLAREACCSWCR